MRLVQNIAVVVRIPGTVDLLSRIDHKPHRHTATRPESGSATPVFCWQHSSVDVVLQIVPCLLTATFKAVNMPANTEVIHKVWCHDNNSVCIADLHKLTGLSTPLISKKAVNVHDHHRFDLAARDTSEHLVCRLLLEKKKIDT